MKKRYLILLTLIVVSFNLLFVVPQGNAASAGLAWSKNVGNLKFYLTNVHTGWAGPKFPNHSHTNFHIDKKVNNKWKSVANFHIVKYSKNAKSCVYIYDSVKKKVIIDKCANNWKDAASYAASAMKSFVKTALDNANWLATLAIWATIVAIIVYIIVPGTALVLSEERPSESTSIDNTPLYNESEFVTEPQNSYPSSAYEQVDLGDYILGEDEDIPDSSSFESIKPLPTNIVEDEQPSEPVITVPKPVNPTRPPLNN